MVLQRDQLSRIKISGYKSIRECDLELKNINVLIGANGSGKSNFISAFSFLQSVLTKGLQLFAAQSGVNSLFYEGRKVTDQIFFEAFFGLNSYGFELVPTDDNRLVFNKEFFGYYWKTDWQSEIARGNFESKWNNGVGNNSDLIQSAAVDSQLIVSTQSVDLLNEFDVEDVIVANRGSRGTELMRLPAESLKVWLEDDYRLGDLWNMNLLGGRPAAEPV